MSGVMQKVNRVWPRAWRITLKVYGEIRQHRVFTAAAALSFYALLSIVPLLIVLASVLRFLPIDNVLVQLLGLMAAFMPPDSFVMVEKVVRNILEPGHGKIVSFGILSYLWAATGGFSALIEALDIAYDVVETRSWWRDRLQSLLLTFTVGALGAISLLTLVVGPEFGHYLRMLFPVSASFAMLWPILRWTFTIATFVTGLELMYYIGPHRRHSFWSTLPGAAVAVGMWFFGSVGLSFYLGHLANYNKTYGSMGALIGLMLWLYITSIAILIGAELNSELGKEKAQAEAQSAKANR